MNKNQQQSLREAEACLTQMPQKSLKLVTDLLSSGAVNADIWGLCGKALFALEQYAQGVVAFNRAFDYQPDSQEYLLFLAKGYLALSDFPRLEQLYDRNHHIFSRLENVPAAVLVLESLSRNDEVLSLLQESVAREPDNGAVNSSLAWCYQTVGRMKDAEKYYRQAIQLAPEDRNARYLLSQLRKFSVDDNNISELESRLKQCESAAGDYRELYAALAKEYEDIGEYEKSYLNLEKVSACAKKHSRHSAEGDTHLFNSVKTWMGELQGAGLVGGIDDESPIFIVGMPRTGSTLVDSILSSHSTVQSLGELGCFRSAFQQVCQDTRGDFFENFFDREIDDMDFSAVGERYIEMLKPLRDDSTFFTDKLPMNYVFLGLIALALPKAKFVHTCRNAMDTCFSNYKMMFGKGYYEYSYDLESVGSHYIGYRDLMAFWHQKFPDRIFDLDYENVVADPERSVRDLLSFLGLEWEEGCLEFYNMKKAVKTASISQVRQPIYTGSVGKWRKFEKHLQPLKRDLESKGITVI